MKVSRTVLNGEVVETDRKTPRHDLTQPGLSLPYRRLLTEVVEGLCAMELRDQGKPIRVGLKDMPP